MPDVKKTTGGESNIIQLRRARGRRRSSSLQTSVSRQKKRDPMYYARLLAAVVLAVVTLAVCICFVFFRLEHVFVMGDPVQDLYAREEIAAAAELEQGLNLVFLNREAIGEKLSSKLPYIESVQVRHRLPDILELTVTRAKPAYRIQGPDGWYLLNAEMKVLEKTGRGTDGYPLLTGFSVSGCTPGEPVDLSQDELGALRCEIVRRIMGSELLDRTLVTEIDLTDVYFVRMIYDDRFTVWLGDQNDLEAKFTLLQRIVSEQEPDVTGRIDLTESGRATLRLD